MRSASIEDSAKPDKGLISSTLGGNAACAHIVYALSEVALVYPMADESLAKEHFTTQSIENCMGSVCQVSMLDTMTGAGAAFLGAASSGLLTTVCASSQSLAHMIPTLRLLVLQRMPAVFHITTGLVDANLMLQLDLSDVFSAAHTGAGLLSSLSVQECHDMALVAHLASHRCGIPFVHFFDCQTARELLKIKLLPHAKLAPFASSLAKDLPTERPLRKSLPDIVDDVMNQLRRVLKRRYRLFEYSGSTNAEYVAISLCSGAGTAALEAAVTKLCNQGAKVGLIKVRVLRPWSGKHFLQALPSAIVKRCVVVGQCNQEASRVMYADVLASIPHLECQVHFAEFENGLSVASASSLLSQLMQKSVPKTILVDAAGETTPDPSFKKVVSWDLATDASALLDLAQIIGDGTSAYVHAAQVQNAYNLGGRVSVTHLHMAPEAFTPPSDLNGPADLVIAQNADVLKQFDVLAQVADGGKILVNAANLDKVPACQFSKLYALDFSKLKAELPLVLQIAVLLLTNDGSAKDAVKQVGDSFAIPLGFRHSLEAEAVQSVIGEVAQNLRLVEKHSGSPANPGLPRSISPSFFAHSECTKREPTDTNGWHATAWRFMFSEAYDQKPAHGPNVAEQQFIIRVKENRRLTPSDYDRNVFHMELDISGTELKYGIGDALGIFPHNQSADVEDFIEFYGLCATDTVVYHKDGHAEIRTVGHILTQVLDLFGRPPRTFFTQLAEFATNSGEKAALIGLGGEQKSAKWDAEYKKLSDGMTTFADVLRDFPSAHPPLVQLMKIVAPIKPRHYSIASAMSFKPNSVDLLIVLVSWQARGTTRYGQATKYLVDAKVGTQITVSVKPSVMKLPADPLAPVIMAGLGTGMAPFRAFIQERVMQRKQGLAVGPMALYFGSRSQFEEYLYGEELEAYHASGLLTLLRCAFSRDQPKKVYIQHKLGEDGKTVYNYLANQPGQFYLCGPTWPCGDVQDAITAAYQRFGNMPADKAAAEIALLKEHERYILEVY